jgi:hypothetical protein
MTELAVTGKINNESKLVDGIVRDANKGTNLAFGLTVFAFAAAVVFFALGDRVAGPAFLSFPVGMLIHSFLVRSDKNEPAESRNS